MYNIKILSVLIFSYCFLQNIFAQPQHLGTESIVDSALYVVYSGMEYNGVLDRTSNIFVFKGTSDTVWIFSTGYGDPNGDIPFYKGLSFEVSRNALADARDVEYVIQNYFGLNKQIAKVMIIVPHMHLDHINAEFISAIFDSLGYSLSQSKIFIHTNDYIGATCDESYCGGDTVKYFGVPFSDSWNSIPYASTLFSQIGDQTDSCGQTVKDISSSVGRVLITKSSNVIDGGHTDGTVNLNFEQLQITVLGSVTRECFPKAGWSVIDIHQNINLTDVADDQINILPTEFQLFQNYPNPFNPSTTLSYYLPRGAKVILKIFDLLGREIVTLVEQEQSAGFYNVIFTGKSNANIELPSGIYFYNLITDNYSQTKKLVLTK